MVQWKMAGYLKGNDFFMEIRAPWPLTEPWSYGRKSKMSASPSAILGCPAGSDRNDR